MAFILVGALLAINTVSALCMMLLVCLLCRHWLELHM
jgi:hypothetical protein